MDSYKIYKIIIIAQLTFIMVFVLIKSGMGYAIPILFLYGIYVYKLITSNPNISKRAIVMSYWAHIIGFSAMIYWIIT